MSREINKFAEVTPGTYINSETLMGFRVLSELRIKFYWEGSENITNFDDQAALDLAVANLIESGVVAKI